MTRDHRQSRTAVSTATKLYLKPAVSPRLVLVDGLGRAGKMLMAKLVSNFRRMEYFQASEPIEHIPILWWLGKLDDETARSFLRIELDAAIYNRAIGRNLNSRKFDSSSVQLAIDHEEYARRASDPNVDRVMERFNDAGRTPLFLTHEALPHIELFLPIVSDLCVIEVVRHPVDLVSSWYRRGWGVRYGADPVAFALTIAHGDRPVPWFAAGWAEEYLALSPMDRVIRSVRTLLDMTLEAYDNLPPDQRRQIHFVAYERLLAAPEREIAATATFLETEPMDGMPEILEREGLAASSAAGQIGEKLKQIKELATPENFASLIDAGRRHERKWDLEPTAV